MGKSFYGGVDGRPFILKRSFATIREMTQNFLNTPGSNANTVNYGEYVIISSVNRNNPENGRLYRRTSLLNEGPGIEYWTYNTEKQTFIKNTTPANGAKYIGTIVGPDGSAPTFKLIGEEFKNLDEIREFHTQDQEIATTCILKPDTSKLFAGSSNNSKNKITFTAYSFRDDNANSSTVYLDMKMPYNVIEFEQDIQLLPSQTTKGLVTPDSNNNAFYQKYVLSLPKGQDGTSIMNIRVITPSAEDEEKLVTFVTDSNGIVRNSDGSIKCNSVTGKMNRAIWVADVVDYKVTDNGTLYLLYLGDYNVIEDIRIDEDGTINIAYTHNDSDSFEDVINWITKVDLSNKGVFTLTTNNDNISNIQKQLHWIEKIEVDEYGTIFYTDVSGNEEDNYTQEHLIKWIKDISLTEDGTFTISFNNDSADYTTSLKWVKNIAFGEDGSVTVQYNNGDEEDYSQHITWIEKIGIAQDGTVTVKTNNDNVVLDENQEKLKWVDKVSLDQNGSFTYGFNNGEDFIVQDEKLKWPTKLEIEGAGTIKTTYSNGEESSTEEAVLMWPVDLVVDDRGRIETVYNNGHSKIQDTRMDWITSATFNQNKELSIEYLKSKPVNVNLKTINDILFKDGGIYALYNTGEEEVFKGTVGEAYTNFIVGGEDTDTSSLIAGGIWFVTEEES